MILLFNNNVASPRSEAFPDVRTFPQTSRSLSLHVCRVGGYHYPPIIMYMQCGGLQDPRVLRGRELLCSSNCVMRAMYLAYCVKYEEALQERVERSSIILKQIVARDI